MWGGAAHEAWEVGGGQITDGLGCQTVELELNRKNNGAFSGIEKVLTRSDLLKKIFIVVKYIT